MDSCNSHVIISTFLAPPVYYYSLIKRTGRVILDLNETYVKQSLRNRYYILSPNGIQRLVIPIVKLYGHQTKTKDVRIDYDKSWIQQHLRSLQTAYGKAPYFLYVWDDIRRCFESNKKFLWELNYELNRLIFTWLDIHVEITFAESFIPIDEHNPCDLRLALKKKQLIGIQKSYYQPFHEKFGFVDGLSVLDTIFCIGLETRQLL